MSRLKKVSNWNILLASILLAVLQRVLLSIAAIEKIKANNDPLTLRSITINVNQWDSGWYIKIAKDGYSNLKQTAFFPMYPFLIRVVHEITTMSYPASGVLISFIGFILTLFFFAKYVQNLFGSMRVALLSALLLTFFPTAYYLNAIYTESLFLCFTFSGLYAASRNRFWTAGILIGMATLTRNTGIFLSFILFFEYVRWRDLDLRFWLRSWWQKLDRTIVSIFIPSILLLVFCVIEKRYTGHFFPFLLAEKLFNRTSMPSWYTFFYTFKYIFKTKGWIQEYYWIEFFSYFLMVVMLFVGMRYLKKSWSFVGWFLYFLAVLWVSTSQPCLNIHDYVVSFPRYALMLFPAFVYAADLLKKRIFLSIVVLAFSSAYLVKLSSIFFSGKWIA